jgi:hypothetical protein
VHANDTVISMMIKEEEEGEVEEEENERRSRVTSLGFE